MNGKKRCVTAAEMAEMKEYADIVSPTPAAEEDTKTFAMRGSERTLLNTVEKLYSTLIRISAWAADGKESCSCCAQTLKEIDESCGLRRGTATETQASGIREARTIEQCWRRLGPPCARQRKRQDHDTPRNPQGDASQCGGNV